LVIFWNIW